MTVYWVGSPKFTAGHPAPLAALVHHRMVGTLRSTDAAFTSTDGREASTNFGVGYGCGRTGHPTTAHVHQYVRLGGQAWGNGNWDPSGAWWAGAPAGPIGDGRCADCLVDSLDQVLGMSRQDRELESAAVQVGPERAAAEVLCPRRIPASTLHQQVPDDQLGIAGQPSAVGALPGTCRLARHPVEPSGDAVPSQDLASFDRWQLQDAVRAGKGSYDRLQGRRERRQRHQTR